MSPSVTVAVPFGLPVPVGIAPQAMALGREVVRGDERVAAVDHGYTATIVDSPREPELFLELIDEPPRLVAIEHVPVAFDSAVAQREVDETA